MTPSPTATVPTIVRAVSGACLKERRANRTSREVESSVMFVAPVLTESYRLRLTYENRIVRPAF